MLLGRALALRDLFGVKMLRLPGPQLFEGGCPVMFLVRLALPGPFFWTHKPTSEMAVSLA